MRLRRAVAAALTAVCAVGVAAADRPPPPPQTTHATGFAFAGMVDQYGRPMQPVRLAGRHVLLNFIFAGCGDTCPLQTAEVSATLKGLSPDERKRLQIVSVSVDPANDTPAVLHAFAANFGANVPNWVFLTGNPDGMRQLVRRYNAAVTTNGRSVATMHSADLVLLNVVRRYRTLPLDRVRLTQDLTMLDDFPKLDMR